MRPFNGGLMAREAINLILDLSVADNKRRLLSAVGVMSGVWEVDIRPRRDTRTLRQNSYYHAVITPALAKYLSDQDYDVTTPEDAHEVLKARFLVANVVNKTTGEILQRRVKSTTSLTPAEFSDYCERCRAWMADFFGIIVPDPMPLAVREQIKTEAAHV